jgi:hypothetical protein
VVLVVSVLPADSVDSLFANVVFPPRTRHPPILLGSSRTYRKVPFPGWPLDGGFRPKAVIRLYLIYLDARQLAEINTESQV